MCEYNYVEALPAQGKITALDHQSHASDGGGRVLVGARKGYLGHCDDSMACTSITEGGERKRATAGGGKRFAGLWVPPPGLVARWPLAAPRGRAHAGPCHLPLILYLREINISQRHKTTRLPLERIGSNNPACNRTQTRSDPERGSGLSSGSVSLISFGSASERTR